MTVVMRVGVAMVGLLSGACSKDAGSPAPREAPAPPAAARPEQPTPDMAEEVSSFVESRVAEGFSSREEIVEDTVEFLRDDFDVAKLQRLVPPVVDAALEAHRKREAGWTTATDCDKLDAAFATLDAAGIIARQNFSDCGTCGAAEIRSLMAEERAAGRSVRGYAFYHEQDNEGTGGGRLYISYGATEEGEQAAVAVGREVVSALSKQGLPTDWDGRLEHRIGVTVDWKKRRFTRAP